MTRHITPGALVLTRFSWTEPVEIGIVQTVTSDLTGDLSGVTCARVVTANRSYKRRWFPLDTLTLLYDATETHMLAELAITEATDR